MSLKGDKYETAEEVKFRLENTVVLYDGKPVYITAVQMPDEDDRKEIARVFFKPMPLPTRGAGVEPVRKYLSSKKFDVAPFRMGYFNHGGEAVFASRLPVRQNKQGLSSATLALSTVKGARHPALGYNTVMTSSGFVDMINGVFPDFKEAGERLGDKDTSSVAVSRSFAFVIDHDLEALFLLHKGVKCGIALKDEKAIKIPPKFRFLREEIEACNIPMM